MVGVDGFGRRERRGMTKGDSCDANPINPLAYIRTHVQALPISVHHLFTFFLFPFFPLFLFLPYQPLWWWLFSGDRRPITVIRS